MPLGVAVVGGGRWGPHLARNFSSHPDTDVVSIVELDPGRREALGVRFPGVKILDDFETVCASPEVDAVVVVTPSSTHYHLVMASLKAGKHVLVEKPLTTNLQDALSLTQFKKFPGQILMVGHVFLFHPAIRAVKEMLDRGEIGEVFYLSMLRTNLGPVRSDTNAAWDLAAHDISIANYWLRGYPTSVSAVGGSYLNANVEDVVFATLRYRNGVVANLHVSWLSPRKARFITIVGDQKMATVDDMDLVEPLRIYDRGIYDSDPGNGVEDTFAEFRSSIRDGGITIPPVPASEPLAAECNEFVDRILGRSSDSTSDVGDGVAVVRALDAVDRSIEQGSAEVAVD